MDYNIDGDDYSRMTNRNNELFIKTSNDLQNSVQIEDGREEQSVVPKIKVEIATGKLIRNPPANQIIGSKEKGVMTRRELMKNYV